MRDKDNELKVFIIQSTYKAGGLMQANWHVHI